MWVRAPVRYSAVFSISMTSLVGKVFFSTGVVGVNLSLSKLSMPVTKAMCSSSCLMAEKQKKMKNGQNWITGKATLQYSEDMNNGSLNNGLSLDRYVGQNQHLKNKLWSIFHVEQNVFYDLRFFHSSNNVGKSINHHHGLTPLF